MEPAPRNFDEASRVELGQGNPPSSAAALVAILGSTIGLLVLTSLVAAALG
jgi:hypothetical protein